VIGGRTVAAAFAGLFLAVAGANGALVWYAVQSWTGFDARSPYDKGLTYNRNLEAAARQAELGWRAGLSADGGAVTVELADRDGRPLAGAEVTAAFERPAGDAPDFDVRLEPQAPGVYRAALEPSAQGLWRVHLTARRGADLYVADHRLTLPPRRP
jgi:nitrogen fixation protein FixH